MIELDEKRTCDQCDHADVCDIYRRIGHAIHDAGPGIVHGIAKVYVALANGCEKFKEEQ